MTALSITADRRITPLVELPNFAPVGPSDAELAGMPAPAATATVLWALSSVEERRALLEGGAAASAVGAAAGGGGASTNVVLRRSDQPADFMTRICEAAADRMSLTGATRATFVATHARVENLQYGDARGMAAWTALRADKLTTGIQSRIVPVDISRLTGDAGAAQAARTPAQRAADTVHADLEASPFLGYSAGAQGKIVADVRAMAADGREAFNRNLTQLRTDGLLDDLLRNPQTPELKRRLIDTLALNADDANAAAVRTLLEKGDVQVVGGPGGAVGVTIAETPWQARFNLVRLGVPTEGPPRPLGSAAGLVSTDPTQPFTGVGASGVNPTTLSAPLGDQLWMLIEKTGLVDPTVTPRYDNPIPGSLQQYLATLTPEERRDQARLSLEQPISTPMRDLWGDRPPTRAQVVEAAARGYNLDPNTVSAFLLAEQRDQSRNEDAKDWAAAVNAGHDSSMGLGQVLISNIGKNAVLQDSMSSDTLRHASNVTGARLLSDDALNIFAVAKYIRQVADAGASRTREQLPKTVALYPGVDFGRYALPSSPWPEDNIRALGTEYTSRPWDDDKLYGWGDFVFEARRDVAASGIHR